MSVALRIDISPGVAEPILSVRLYLSTLQMCPFSTGGGIVFVSCAWAHDHDILEADCLSPETCPGLAPSSSSKGAWIRFAWCHSGEQADMRCFEIGVGHRVDGSAVHIFVTDPSSCRKPSPPCGSLVWSEVRRFVECVSFSNFRMSRRGILQVATRKHLNDTVSTALSSIAPPWRHTSLDDAFDFFFNAKAAYTLLQQESRPPSRK